MGYSHRPESSPHFSTSHPSFIQLIPHPDPPHPNQPHPPTPPIPYSFAETHSTILLQQHHHHHHHHHQQQQQEQQEQYGTTLRDHD
ncbi:hypothetical protein M0802_005733 [Mischocyttarus mexicanus]|nr:hypothetical protein M0802_005733 [Mischocyttarus mexicanus]